MPFDDVDVVRLIADEEVIYIKRTFRCSMCPAIHINSRSWLHSSLTCEPSDSPLKSSTITIFTIAYVCLICLDCCVLVNVLFNVLLTLVFYQ